MLDKKVKKWVSALKVHSLLSDKLFASISSTIIKSLEYPASALTFSEKQCNKLVKPIFDLVLPKCKICRIIPLTVKYRSREAIGLGFKNLFHTQGISKLIIYMKEKGSNTLASILVNANYEAALVNLRIRGYSLFNADYKTFQYLLPPL